MKDFLTKREILRVAISVLSGFAFYLSFDLLFNPELAGGVVLIIGAAGVTIAVGNILGGEK